MQGKNQHRGQIFSTELMVSISVFLGALIAFLFVWNSMHGNYAEEQSDARMQVALIGISDAAVMSPGNPADWDITAGENASSFGFAVERGVLSPSKLYSMQGYFAANYSDMKYKMGAGGYELFVEVKDTLGNQLYAFGSRAPEGNSSISALGTDRLALIGGELAKVHVEVWREKGRGL
jgi:hypothetical protein